MKLTDTEYNLLNRIATETKMDCWFWLKKSKDGDDYVYDLENSKRMSLRNGVKQLLEGISGMYGKYLTSDEKNTIIDLLIRM